MDIIPEVEVVAHETLPLVRFPRVQRPIAALWALDSSADLPLFTGLPSTMTQFDDPTPFDLDRALQFAGGCSGSEFSLPSAFKFEKPFWMGRKMCLSV